MKIYCKFLEKMPNGEALLGGRLPRQRPRNACQLRISLRVPPPKRFDGEREKGDIDIGARLKKFRHLALMGDVKGRSRISGATVYQGDLKG